MKINSINSFTGGKAASFKHGAVPYPEYQRRNTANFRHGAVPYPEYLYLSTEENKNKNIIDELSEKISDLFHPHVQKEAAEIKSGIDSIYDEKEQSGEAVSAFGRLSEVFA